MIYHVTYGYDLSRDVWCCELYMSPPTRGLHQAMPANKQESILLSFLHHDTDCGFDRSDKGQLVLWTRFGLIVESFKSHCNNHWIRFAWCFKSWQHLRSSRWVLTCDNVHSWWLYSAAPLWDQATNMTWNHIIRTLSPCPILIVPSAWLGSDKYHNSKSLVWLDQGSNLQLPWVHTVTGRSLPLPDMTLNVART